LIINWRKGDVILKDNEEEEIGGRENYWVLIHLNL